MDKVSIELSAKELKALTELLEEHFFFGWVYMEGEWSVVASGQVSPTLRELYGRLKEARQRDQAALA
jgi:hypothetical protein